MMLPFALLLAVQSAEAPPSGAGASAEMIANCNARKFETVVQVMKDGAPHSSKVTICGKVGQSDAEWAGTLKDALNKVSANPRMAAAVKDQIVTALKFELAKVAPTAEARVEPVSPPAVTVATTVPPLPETAPPLIPRPSASVGAPVEYSALPPMPAPKPAVTTAIGAAAAVTPQLPAPRLTLSCQSTTAMIAEGPCDQLDRETMMTVVAGEDVPGGTSLRFLRRGDNRAEVDLVPLKRGQSQRFTLPARVCQGVTGSRVEVQVVRAVKSSSQVVDTRGPFDLRC